jgi:hypothetical protein
MGHQEKGLYVDIRFFYMLHSKHACLQKIACQHGAKLTLTCLKSFSHVESPTCMLTILHVENFCMLQVFCMLLFFASSHRTPNTPIVHNWYISTNIANTYSTSHHRTPNTPIVHKYQCSQQLWYHTSPRRHARAIQRQQTPPFRV